MQVSAWVALWPSGWGALFAFMGVLLRNACRTGCGTYYQNHSNKSMVPGAGIEPARLAAGDFESGAISIFHAGLRPVFFRKEFWFWLQFSLRSVFLRNAFSAHRLELRNLAPIVLFRECNAAVLQEFAGTL